MAFYNRLKTMKSAPVGTIIPWGGQSSQGNNPQNIPTGWIVCDGRTFDASDFTFKNCFFISKFFFWMIFRQGRYNFFLFTFF